jgi:hypothetical protein
LPFRFGNNPNKQGSRKPVVKGLTTPYQQPDQAKESGVMIEDFSKSILEGIESIELEYGNIDLSEIPTADDLFRGLK